MNHLNVLTGGPGSGKTTVIEILADRNFTCAEEVGRKIIKTQVAKQGHALPWLDQSAFRDETFREEIESHGRYKNSDTPVFFDRGLVDTYGYSKLENLEISDELISCCHNLRYSTKVFLFPPWREIYSNDAERRESFSEAQRTYDAMVNAYNRFNYTLIKVPKASAEDRVEFILESVNNS